MDMFALVRTEYLNHFGRLFGGQLLKWVDEFAWLVATRDFPNSRLVTRALDHVEFTRGVENGSILRFTIALVRRGRTSATYSVQVFASQPPGTAEVAVFETAVTFVSVDREGRKANLA